MHWLTGILSILYLTICRGEQTTTVHTSLGAIKGIRMETRLGAKFWSFRGIRYAEPPEGELRFQNPQPVRAWKPKEFDATKDGPMCPQITVNRTWLSEDCLRLNVYTKNLNATNGLNPVIVYLHPGAFFVFSAISVYAGPENFMDRDIVLVTLNYRLASLGFLATGTPDAPGNMALKDQVIALRWVQSHIEKFGGDSKSVTLWGYSAGSISVGLHVLSPMSKGLFHRGIMQSASPLAQFRFGNNQTQLAEKQARLLNCPVTPVKDMIKCLKTKPMLAFVDTTEAMFEFEYNPGLNWMPVIESNCDQERFLVEDPFQTMMTGNINKVPLIVGITEFEFYSSAYYILRNDTQRERFNQNSIEKYAPIYLFYERETPKSRNITHAIQSYYFQNESLKFPQSLASMGQLFTDVMAFQYHRFVDMASKHVPVYAYLFTYKGRYSHFRNPETNQTYGAMHHDELLYLLYVPLMTPMFSKTDPENNIIERLTRMWFEFAKKSDPNNSTDEYLTSLKWPLHDATRKQYLEIGNDLKVKCNGVFPKRMQFWDHLFPLEDMLNSNL